jgi:superfamily II DNA or RNA helicase
MNFRRGVIPLLIAVDVLNEGVDIPDVNIVCFARVTHSRRIFVQQVGRGLRLSSGKEHVTVIDFVSDLRRVAEVLHLRRAIVQDLEDVFLPSSHSITFEDKRVESLMSEWLLDVADIELDAENARFDFPDFLG